MKKLLNSKWTSIKKKNGYIHYQVRNILIKKKQIEIYAVCNKNISFNIDIKKIKDKSEWVPGWKEL